MLKPLSAWMRRSAALLTALLALPAAAQIVRVPADLNLGAPSACPVSVPAGSRCESGREPTGAHYWLVVPPDWNGTLVMHAHGGPDLGPARNAAGVNDDLRTWSIWPRAGYAYGASGYRQGGFEVRAAAEDLVRVRQRFTEAFGAPVRTVLHGQSWGAAVALQAAERHPLAPDGSAHWDAVLLTSGVVAPGTRAYTVRHDLRVVYQAICANHPAPGEPDYPLWQGLPLASRLGRDELARRVDDCTGLRRAPEARTEAQAARLRQLLAVTRIPASQLLYHLNWATWHLQDLVMLRLGGRNPFDNENVVYRGSDDDEALNRRVARHRADPAAVAALAADADIAGRIGVPVLTLHGVGDGIVFVEQQAELRDTFARGGSAERLLQVYVSDSAHGNLGDAAYLSAIEALLAWQAGGARPEPAEVAARCQAQPAVLKPASACRFLPTYQPGPLASRVAPRGGER